MERGILFVSVGVRLFECGCITHSAIDTHYNAANSQGVVGYAEAGADINSVDGCSSFSGSIFNQFITG